MVRRAYFMPCDCSVFNARDEGFSVVAPLSCHPVLAAAATENEFQSNTARAHSPALPLFLFRERTRSLSVPALALSLSLLTPTDWPSSFRRFVLIENVCGGVKMYENVFSPKLCE